MMADNTSNLKKFFLRKNFKKSLENLAALV